jgi:hypothetical protein
VTSPLIQSAIDLARRSLAKYGQSVTVTWPGLGGTATRRAVSVTETILAVPGKRDTQIVNGAPVAILHALLAPLSRNPVGATVAIGAAEYKVIASDDLGQAPDAIAAHKVLLV